MWDGREAHAPGPSPRLLTSAESTHAHLAPQQFQEQLEQDLRCCLNNDLNKNLNEAGTDFKLSLNSKTIQAVRSDLSLSLAEADHNAEVLSNVVNEKESLRAQARRLIAAGVFFLGS